MKKPNRLRKVNHPQKEKKVWQLWDVFPFGNFKGVPLSHVAENNPSLLEWWQNKKQLIFSDSLTQKINHYKNLSI